MTAPRPSFLRKALPASAALLMSVSALTACSGGASTGSGGGGDGKPTEISIITEFSTPEPPGPGNPVTKEFEKRTNTKLNITWVSPNSWPDKQNVVLASGDMPDLMKVTDFTNTQMQQMVKQGAFWDLTPYLKDYKHLMEYPKEIWDKSKMYGKNYVIPSVRPLEGASFYAIRKDWLDNLNLKVPETMDEFYRTLKAFTTGDPDKNGKDDTYGFTSKNYARIPDIFNGSNGRWKVQGGKLTDTELEPGTREGLLWLNRLYKEKLMPEDFAVMKTTQFEDMAKAGKAGVTQDTVEGIWRARRSCARRIRRRTSCRSRSSAVRTARSCRRTRESRAFI